MQVLSINVNGVKQGTGSVRFGSTSPSSRRQSQGDSPRLGRKPSLGKLSVLHRSTSDMERSSVLSDKNSDGGSPQSGDSFRSQNEHHPQSKLATSGPSGNSPTNGDSSEKIADDVDLLGFGDGDDDERLSDISDGGLSMGTETDGSIASVVEYTLFPQPEKPADKPMNTEQ